MTPAFPAESFRQKERRIASALGLSAITLHHLLKVYRGEQVTPEAQAKLRLHGFANDQGYLTQDAERLLGRAEKLGYSLGAAPPAFKPPKPLSDVAIAQPEDLSELVGFLFTMREEIDDGYAEDDLIKALSEALVRREYGIAFIIRGNSGIEASLGLLFERPRLARAYRLRSVWNIVAPRVHDTGHAKSLLTEAKRFADRIGRPLYLDVCLPPTPQPIKDRQLEPSSKVRLCSRYLETAGRIFAHVPESVAG